ncbi:MAG TPA: M14 family zinc carboxypeptidase [Patescibacteria group bacterium]|nr:M14 family zinc carboxypeptidase [Patescibacteria group bacterium]
MSTHRILRWFGLMAALGGFSAAALLCSARAQTLEYHKEDTAAHSSKKMKKAAATASRAEDVEYTAKIQEYTTEPYLTTDLVNHLPASATVPTPEKILGYVIGTPNKLTHTADIYRYYRALAQATPRVKVWTTGKSEEGRDFLLVAVSDESNMAQLDEYKRITAQLADPRKINDDEAKRLVHDGKPIYWLSGSIHSPETGSPEMLMELAYRLAVEDSPLIDAVRKNVIVLITPVLEVDGRDRDVDLYNYRKANPDKAAPNLIYWGHYVAHDNNRDAIAMGLALSRNQMRTFLDWHPQVLHDLHESVPFLYTSTGTGPYNAWLDPIVVSEWQELAYYEIQNMTERGVPGVWTHGFYDGWAANYMIFAAQGHNSIGRFYETFGGRGADTSERTVPPALTSRTWFRPNPPLAKIKWSIRDNINMQQSALLFALDYMAKNGQAYLQRFYEKSKRAVGKATTEGPAAWAIVNDGRRPELAAQLAALFQSQGAEVQSLEKDFTTTVTEPKGEHKGDGKDEAAAGEQKPAEKAADGKGKDEKSEKKEPKTVTIPAGSYILRMDQPYSRLADMLLDTQYYSTNDPRPYDDTGWTLGPLRDVKTVRITDTAILKAAMRMVTSPARAEGGVEGAGAAKLYIVDATAEPAIATLRFRLKDVAMSAAEDGFEADGKKFHAGALLIAAGDGVRAQLDAAAKDAGLRVYGTSADVNVARHAVGVPRIALLHTWTTTQSEGWFRLMLEEAKIPYTYISDQMVRQTPNLKDKFDVILFPPGPADVPDELRGLPKRTLPDGKDDGGPIPWKKSELTQSFGDGPDQTEDVRGGLGLEGAEHLEQFVEAGGVLIPVGRATELPIDLGITECVSIAPTKQLQARGAVLNADVADRKSPIAYGYDEHVGVYFNQAPVLRVSIAGGGPGFNPFGEQPGRTSGRGSLTDPDIPQGRPWNPPEAEPKRTKVEQETYIDPELRDLLRGEIPPPVLWPRVVLRFAPEKSLWASGMLAGAGELAETPAVVDVPVGRGHVVLFAINPMWRQETQGSFMLVMNAALNWDHLAAGWKAPAEAAAPAGTKTGGGAEE